MDMNRSLLVFPMAAILLALSVSSCRDAGVHDALVRAEALMEDSPRVARAILDSIASPNPPLKGRASESTSLPSFRRGKGEAALYALLRTQADYKCRVRLTSDSLPLIATNYYGTRRKTQRAALAQYYLGCAYSDMGRDLDAIDALLRATTLFPDTTNKYYANSLFELGLLYLNHHMNEKAYQVLEQYRLTNSCQADSVLIGYVNYYMGQAAAYEGNDILADSLYKCVLMNTNNTDGIRYDSYFQLAKIYFYHWHETQKAMMYNDKYIAFYTGKRSISAAQSLKADILLELNELELADKYYKEVLRNSKDIYTLCSTYKGLANVSSLLNIPDSTRFYINQYALLLDSIYSINKQMEIAEIQDKHIVEIHDQQLKARHVRFMLLGGLFFVVAFSAFAITLLLNDRKRKNERLRFEQELRDIKQRHIDQNVREEPELEEEETSIPESENDVLDIQTNTSVPPRLSIQQERVALYRKQYKDSEWARYFREHQLEIRSKDYITPKDSDRFMAYLHELFADIFLDMVNDNQELTRQDLEYSAMVMLGFNTVQMSYCARVSSHSLHNRRYRMKEKLTSEWYTLIFGIPK